MVCVVSLYFGCKRSPGDGGTTPEGVWNRSQYDYKTNDIRTAYPLIVVARDKLARMWEAKEGGLDYPYCLAILNGRLFLMAQALQETNDAKRFFIESSVCWNQVRKELRLEPTNYSAEHITALIRKYDAGVVLRTNVAAARPEKQKAN